MTWEEIRNAYPDQWVIIEFQKLDGALEILDGRVIAAAPTRDEIYRRVMTDGRGRDVAIRYCGDLPPDFAVMFWLRRKVPWNLQSELWNSMSEGWPSPA